MKASLILSALLPVLALAQDPAQGDETATVTSTMTLTQTIQLMHVETRIAGLNETSSAISSATSSIGASSTSDPESQESTAVKDENAGVSLVATNAVLAGLAGMVTVLLM